MIKPIFGKLAFLAFLSPVSTAFSQPFFAKPVGNFAYYFEVKFDSKSAEAASIYIDRHAVLAIREMERHGIPASITLAQALVETGNGSSQLAVEDLNHFGIKCHNWEGEKTLYKDDDLDKDGNLIESCFRKYESVEASYADRSEYLKKSKRYASLFDLASDDYAGWARGLKAAGYATSKTYAQDLIRKIEQLELYKFDQMTTDEVSEFVEFRSEKNEKVDFFKDETVENTDAFKDERIEKAQIGRILGGQLPERRLLNVPPPTRPKSMVYQKPIFISLVMR